MRTALALVVGFVAGVFVASTSRQMRAELAARAAAGDDPALNVLDDALVVDDDEARTAAMLRGMGVDVGPGPARTFTG